MGALAAREFGVSGSFHLVDAYVDGLRDLLPEVSCRAYPLFKDLHIHHAFVTSPQMKSNDLVDSGGAPKLILDDISPLCRDSEFKEGEHRKIFRIHILSKAPEVLFGGSSLIFSGCALGLEDRVNELWSLCEHEQEKISSFEICGGLAHQAKAMLSDAGKKCEAAERFWNARCGSYTSQCLKGGFDIVAQRDH